MQPDQLSLIAWVLLVIGAAVVGFAKTAVGGAGALAVVAFATAVPAKESTGALLPLLCVGDVVAVTAYHRHANWSVLLRLLPGVVPGLVLGVCFVSIADEATMRHSIGVVLLVMTAVHLRTLRSRRESESHVTLRPQASRVAALPTGIAAGFATMTANAAGPVTTLYLIAAGLPMMEFLGTAAWFYLLVNAAKIPLSAGLSLISPGSLLVDAVLVPALGLGTLAGIAVVKRIEQAQFERAALGLAAVASLALVL